MVKSPLWLRVLAPCLALSVGGGYVWMRHKQAEAAEIQAQAVEAEAAKKRSVLPGSKSPFGVVDAELIDQGGTVLPGSKSGGVIRYKPAPPEEEKEEPALQVLPGSKSGIMLTPPPEERPRTVLPGSKSALILENPPPQQQAAPAQQAAEPKPEKEKP